MCAVVPITSIAFAQTSPLDAEQRRRAIEGVLRTVRDGYVFPDVAKKMESQVRDRAARGEYDFIVDGQKLADRLTTDLREVSRDLHLQIHYSAATLPQQPSQ